MKRLAAPLTVTGALVAVVAAGFAAAVAPVAGRDWLLSGAILLGALLSHRRGRAVVVTTAAWSVAAGVAVHLTLAVAVVVVAGAYGWLRRGLAVRDAGALAGAVVAAHFVVSSGAWATPSPPALPLVVGAGVAHLVAYHVLSWRFRGTDLGLEAALLATGAIAGAIGSPVAVLAAVPVVLMLRTAGLTRQLETEASVDKKTGLATADAWQARAEGAFASDGPIGVLMIDLDHFKRLNDTYGHRAGDDVLAAVGACLRSELRHADLAGRFGGEEFTVLLPGADLVDTMATAERLRLAIADLRVTSVDKRGRHTVITGVTASIGAATSPHHATTVRDCLRVADGHAYQAKRQGRNTVVGIDTFDPTTNPPGGPATSVAERG